MLTSTTAPQMPSTATGRPHRAIRSRAGKAAPNMTKPVATAPQIQIVSATIGTWSWLLEIRSGANTLLSAMASQRPATATAAGSIRPVRWSRSTSWILGVTTSVAVMRSSSLLEAPASTTSWRRPPCAVTDISPLCMPGRKGRTSLDVRSTGPPHLLLSLLSFDRPAPADVWPCRTEEGPGGAPGSLLLRIPGEARDAIEGRTTWTDGGPQALLQDPVIGGLLSWGRLPRSCP